MERWVVFWKAERRSEADNESDLEEIDQSEKSRRRFVLKFYRVF